MVKNANHLVFKDGGCSFFAPLKFIVFLAQIASLRSEILNHNIYYCASIILRCLLKRKQLKKSISRQIVTGVMVWHPNCLHLKLSRKFWIVDLKFKRKSWKPKWRRFLKKMSWHIKKTQEELQSISSISSKFD